MHGQASGKEVEDTDSSDWDNNSEEDCMDTEEEEDIEQQGGIEGDIL